MNAFLHGALLTGFGVAALFFARFWRETRDRFFALFAAAFAFMAADQLAPVFLGHDAERDVRVFLLRLLAYALILAAIVDKNRAPRER